jgi:hypothetical protein
MALALADLPMTRTRAMFSANEVDSRSMLKSAGFVIVLSTFVACQSPENSPPQNPQPAAVTSSDASAPIAPSDDAGVLNVDASADDGGSGLSVANVKGDLTDSGVSLRVENPTITGNISQDEVLRIIRINYGRFRLCYERGLRSNPTLAGRVDIHFVIDAQGNVKSVTDSGATLHDDATVACVRRGFTALDFPQPSSGAAKVTYPLVFAPHR